MAKRTGKSIIRMTVDGFKQAAESIFRRGQQTSPQSLLRSVDTSSPGYATRRHAQMLPRPAGAVYTRKQWLQSILQSNDLIENSPSVRSIIRQVPIQAVSFGPSVNVSLAGDDTENTTGTRIAEYLTAWGKDCDWNHRNGMTLNRLLFIAALEMQAANTFLIVFDDFILDNGKLLAYSAEQYAHMSQPAWDAFCKARGIAFKHPITGELSSGTIRNGRVYDAVGRLAGYCVDTVSVYMQESDQRNCMFIPKFSAFEFSLPDKPYGDAMSPIASIYDNAVDAEELRASTIEVAKNEASLSFAHSGGKSPVKVEVGSDGEITEEEQEEIGLVLESTGELPEEVSSQVSTATGLNCISVPGNGKITPIESAKPSKGVTDHYQRITTETGITLGVYASLSQGKVDANYSAGRGEMVLTWSWFYIIQDTLDNGLVFLQKKKIQHAIRTGQITDPAQIDRNWKDHIENVWPIMPQIDPEKEVNANVKGLEYGITNYSDLHGPGWRRRFNQHKTEYLAYKDNEVPNKAYESTPGAVGTVPQPKQ